MPFEHRLQAARRLARLLGDREGTQTLVLATTPGGAPIAHAVAEQVRGELDMMLVAMLPARENPGIAVACVDETGGVHLLPAAQILAVDPQELAAEIAPALGDLAERRGRFTPHAGPPSAAGRDVILVDDGSADHATLLGAVAAIRAQGPARLAVALAVAVPETLARLSPLADQVVCLEIPPTLRSPADFYVRFPPVDVEQVATLLNRRTHAA